MTDYTLGVLPRFRRQNITDPDWVAQFARVCEEGGVESIWGVEHVLVAVDYEPLYPYSESGQMPGNPDTVMPDPLEWLSFVAACTSRVKLGTAVVILTQHSPVTMAKRVATLDALSRGRMMLGVGIGWQKEEYAALGIPYADRGRRLDEYIDALRALWGNEAATHKGRYVQFDRVRSDPKPAQPGGVPIIVGGSSEAAARRAGERGDGWLPYTISPDDFAARVVDLNAAARAAGRDPAGIELTAWPTSYRFDALFDVDLAQRYADAGATRFLISAEAAGGSGDIDDIARLIGDVHERLLGKLR